MGVVRSADEVFVGPGPGSESRLSPEIVVAIGLMFAVQLLWVAALVYAAYRFI